MATNAQIEAHEEIKPTKATYYKRILKVLERYPDGLNAQEVAEKLGYSTRQDVAPRITELVDMGRIYETDRRSLNRLTGKMITVYQSKDNWFKERSKQ